MLPPKSKRLVIDASVVHASGGEDAAFPISKYCRDFLQTIYKVCHCIVMTTEIEAEWKKHQSHFAIKWRRYMTGKKKIYLVNNTNLVELRQKFESLLCTNSDRKNMLKDIHLIEAALATDNRVVSLDNLARNLFSVSSAKIGEVKNILWVDPSKPEEEPLKWLEKWAPDERPRRLGYESGQTSYLQ